MGLKRSVYYYLLDRHPLLKRRYLEYARQGGRGMGRKLAYLVLLHLKRLLGGKGLALPKGRMPYAGGSESALGPMPSPEEFAMSLEDYDVISFDMFDTLVLRPVSHPAELFHFVGERLEYLQFAGLRQEGERIARRRHVEQTGNSEITLKDIYKVLEERFGIPAEQGMNAELEIEGTLLFANPYMQRVYRLLRQRGKRVIVTTDMYLPSSFLSGVLDKTGYEAPEALFVSNEYGCGKEGGPLFEKVKQALGTGLRYAHVGDNPAPDGEGAAAAGFSPFACPNVNDLGVPYRVVSQSVVMGGVYRGLVNAHLHSGLYRYSFLYEYGFVVGGLLVAGYCRFIHDYARTNHMDKILFLSRDGWVLKEAYDRMFPGEATAYAYWSRTAAAKLGARWYKHDYLRRVLDHNIGKGLTLGRVLDLAGLEAIALELLRDAGQGPQTPLDNRSAREMERSMLANWERILEQYKESREAAGAYYRKLLAGCKAACTVDVGWAGSGGVMLARLAGQEWGLPCRLTGLIAGTNTPFTDEPDASEPLIQAGIITPYLFSQAHNRELWRGHNPHQGHNLFLEMLLSAPEPGLSGFGRDEEGQAVPVFFGKENPNRQAVNEIHKGILDFIGQYKELCEKVPSLQRVSGSDAYAPFQAAMGSKAYRRRLKEAFRFEEGIG